MNEKMNEKIILMNRVINHIGFIKRHLANRKEFSLYNDFLIIGQIVPKLPKQTLLELLQILKPLNDYMNKTPSLPPMNISPLLDILEKVTI